MNTYQLNFDDRFISMVFDKKKGVFPWLITFMRGSRNQVYLEWN
jgi:hypothetical protein